MALGNGFPDWVPGSDRIASYTFFFLGPLFVFPVLGKNGRGGGREGKTNRDEGRGSET